ncbi:prepilin cleavage protein [Fluoribacter dumoffii]|uniref:Tfp pilus assembly protein PilW n=1 Tax=Fluoribacter dumoffii TaxID=463 RepID=A0A377GAE1_9GAMM|nr:hypothetical protein [Fluoribacter dumoffii]KTC88716.1 hypothetical protein Ldum_2974 [Fluoribacter dumoffii NY 23]MCW8385991.1 prepilin cleavage protein [Fluoribacter dumoffii]MCW8419043.1 prepilin cleavage protein [Fluoribacter dumoffii]MCW8453113.1 prepilin cleavage protein [Fluoribacter dumoffii]MCW8459669.1 prepilin cleavage protein [Fluoribacter dumoffii]
MKKQAGISLTEILISLFLTSVMITVLVQLYLISKRQYMEIEKILTMRFDVQWAIDLLSDSIRRAGFTPCLSIDRLHVVDRRNPRHRIYALQTGNQPHPYIEINRMTEYFAKIVKIRDATKVLVQNQGSFHRQRLVLIADCEHAEIQEVVNIEEHAGNSLITLSKPLLFSYGKGTYIGEYLEEKWLIRKNTSHENTLHYQRVKAEEVTPLIHFMHIRNRRIKEKQFLEIILDLDEDKTQEIKVVVRGS